MTAPLLMFHDLADYYDGFLAEKDYRGEAQYLERIVRRYGRSGGNAWLDVGCGTGRHLAHLRRSFEVVGVDASSQMLRVARRRLPGVRLVRGDMRSFRLRERFDVVSCLFGAIGHVSPEREVRAALANFARHLRPGGVALVEPWIDPSDFRPGFVHLMTGADRGVQLVRLSYSTRRGNHTVIRSHYLVGRPRAGVRHLQETDDSGLLLSHDRIEQLLERAGLRPRFLARGLSTGRGLFLGVKPA